MERKYANCPICDDCDMLWEPDGWILKDGEWQDGGWVVRCTNLACRSNGGDNDAQIVFLEKALLEAIKNLNVWDNRLCPNLKQYLELKMAELKGEID